MKIRNIRAGLFGGLKPVWFNDDPADPGDGGGGAPPAAPAATAMNPGDGGGDPAPADPPADPNAGGDDPKDPPAEPNAGGDDPKDPPAEPFYKNVPDDWRSQVAKAADEKDAEAIEKLLSRYNTLPEAMKALHNAQSKIRAGEVAKGLPDNPTDEQLKEFREANGIPETPDKYAEQIKLEDGIVLGEQDQTIMQEVYKTAHEMNLPPGQVGQLANSMLKARENEAAKMDGRDKHDATQTQSVLKEQWGADFEANKNMVHAFVNQLPEESRDAMMNARMGDGRALMNSPEVVDMIAKAQRALNPMAAVLPGDSTGGLKTVEAEIKQLEERMGSDEWFKDKDAQERYQQLVSARNQARSQG